MGIPTWRNVDAPDYSAANKMLEQGNARQSGAFTKGHEIINDFSDVTRDRGTGDALAQISQLNDIDNFDQQRSALLANLNMGNVNQSDVMDALGEQRDTLDTRDQYAFERQHRDELMAMEKSALGARIAASNRSGRGGGGGSGGGGAGAYGGANGASPEDMLFKALGPEMEGMNPVEADEYFMGKIRQFDMSTKQGRYTIKNSQGNAQTRYGKKKSDAYSAKTSITDKIVNSGESSWYSMLPGAGMNFDGGANLETERLVLDARAAGVKENDIIKNITDNRSKNRVSDRYKTKKGFERLTRAAKAARGEE